MDATRNAGAKALYHWVGFVENGEMDGEEVVAVLKLWKDAGSYKVLSDGYKVTIDKKNYFMYLDISKAK